jgi:hypothetical protein
MKANKKKEVELKLVISDKDSEMIARLVKIAEKISPLLPQQKPKW